MKNIIEKRPERPYACTIFKAHAKQGAPSLASLKAVLQFWTACGPGEKPRWKGVLAPSPPDLFNRVLEKIENGEERITLRAYRYDANGLDAMTLIDYHDAAGQHIGWDYVLYETEEQAEDAAFFTGYDALSWWEYPQFLLDLPVYTVIGTKELCGELLKSPLKALDAGWFGTAASGRAPISPVCFKRAAGGFLQDWKNGGKAFMWRFRMHHKHTPLDLGTDLLGALPLIGPLFDRPGPPPGTEPEAPALIAFSQGIHAGGERNQYVQGWKEGLQALRPETKIACISYPFGGFTDTIWSLLNLSNGMGYDAAEKLVFKEKVTKKDQVVLIGFSGGHQRFVSASRILENSGFPIRMTIGIAGPATGNASAFEAYSLRSKNFFADPIVIIAQAVDVLLFFLPGNIQPIDVPRGGGHHTPLFPNGTTRAPEAGYRGALQHCLKQ